MADPNEYVRQRYNYDRLNVQPSTPVTVSEPTSKVGRVSRTVSAPDMVYAELGRSIDSLRKELIQKYRDQEPYSSDEVIIQKAEEELKTRLPKPVYGGEFELTRPQAPIIEKIAPPALATPENLPGEASLFEVLGARTKAPERAKAEDVFDTIGFERSIANLPQKDQIIQRGTMQGLMNMYNYVREIRPDLKQSEVLSLAENQLADLQAGLKGQASSGIQQIAPKFPSSSEILGGTGEKGILETLQEPQILSESRLQFTPNAIQKKFLEKFEPSYSAIKRLEASEEISKTPIEVPIAGPGGGSSKTTRKRTEEEIQKEVANLEKSGAFKLPIEFYPEEMKEFVADPEKFATGGVIFDKEYPSGLVIESPANQLLRIATSPLNAVAGFIGGVVKQIPGVVDLDELSASRPEKYRGTGIRENIIANIQDVGGFSKEASDIAQHNSFIKNNPQIAGPFVLGGVALDFIGVDEAILKGITGFFRGAAAAGVAAKATRPLSVSLDLVPRMAVTSTKRIAETGIKEGLSSAIGALNIPGAESLAKSIEPGDVRLTYGSVIGQQMIQKNVFNDLSRKIDQVANKNVVSYSELLKERSDIVRHESILRKRISEMSSLIDNIDQEMDSAFKRSGKERNPDQEAIFKTSYKDAIDSDIKYSNSQLSELSSRMEQIDSQIAGLKSGKETGFVKTSDTSALAKKVNELLPIAIRSLDDKDKKVIVSIKNNLPSGEKATASNILYALKRRKDSSGNFDLSTYTNLKSKLIQYAAFERGVQEIDRALSRVGMKGKQLISVTPNILATKKAADQIEAAYKDTGFYNDLLKDGLNKQSQRLLDNKLQAVLELDIDQSRTLRYYADELKDRISPDLYNRIKTSTVSNVGEGTKPFALVSDIREMSYAVADAIASQKKLALSKEMLLEKVPSRAPIAGGSKITVEGERLIKRGRRQAELVSDYPVWINRLVNSVNDKLSPLSNMYDPKQKDVIQKAKNRVSAIAIEFKDEFRLAKSDPGFQSYLQIGSNASDNEIITALISNGGRSHRRFVEHLVDSMIYSTNQTSLQNALFPSYNWGSSILKDKASYKKLIQSLSSFSESRILENLNEIFDQVKNIVDNEVNLELKAAGGKIVAVPPSLSKEVLISAYVRKKSEDILTDTLGSMYSQNPLQITEGLQSMMNIKSSGFAQYNDAISAFYKAVAIQNEVGDLVTSIKLAGVGSPELDKIIDTIVPYGSSNRGIVKARFRLEIIKSLETLNETGVLDGILSDIYRTAEVYKTYNTTDMVNVMESLIKNKIPAGSFVIPEIALQVKRDLGSVTEFNQFQKELALLSEEALNGKVNAGYAMKIINEMLKHYNSAYYFLMLSINPRFHGVNNITAPLVIAYTTGRWPIFNLTGGVKGPTKISPLNNYLQAANTVSLLGFSDDVSRNVAVVTDRFGNTYTRGMLYDMSIKSGIFKSQFRASVPTAILEDIKSTIEPDIIRRQRRLEEVVGPGIKRDTPDLLEKASQMMPEKILGQPLASYSDDVHRMTVVIDALSSGSTIEDALDLGRRSLFDYGNITEPEKMISRHFFVFYNYWRQSVLQFMKNIVSDPVRMMKYLKMTKVLSNVSIGQQNGRDLSFYYPPDWGVSRFVFSFEPEASYAEGRAILAPQMPYSDAINVVSQAILNPISLLLGPPKAGPDAGRAYDQGVIYERLGPFSKLIGQQIFTGQGLQNVAMKPRRVPIEHAALFRSLDLERTIQSIFPSYKWIPAEPGEKSANFDPALGNMVVELDDIDTEKYRQFLSILNTTGASRPINDWSRMMNSGVLQGPYPEGWLEWLSQSSGLITVTGAALPEVVHKKAIDAQTREVQKQVQDLKSRQGRLPQRTK